VEVTFNPAVLYGMTHSPRGVGAVVCSAAGRTVAAGAKRRALRRTGRMADEITWRLVIGAEGVSVQVISPARDPKTGFPYPIVHEVRHPRDRRPHRSLVPALADIARVPGIIRFRITEGQ